VGRTSLGRSLCEGVTKAWILPVDLSQSEEAVPHWALGAIRNARLFHSQPRARNSEAWPVRVVADALSATTAEGCYLDSRRTERRGCYIISRQSRPSASTSMWLWITFGSKGDLRRPSVRQSAITEDF